MNSPYFDTSSPSGLRSFDRPAVPNSFDHPLLANTEPRVSTERLPNEKSIFAAVISHLGVAADLFEVQLYQKLPWNYVLEFQAQGCSSCLHRPYDI